MKVGHSTQQKLVLEQDFQLPEAKQGVSEVSVDGGKVRIRGKLEEGCYWRDDKTVCTYLEKHRSRLVNYSYY